VCSSASRRVISSSIEGTLASSTASLLTYAAYGLEEWSFVAPTDCGLGLFARDKIQTHQVIGEYAGPRLPGKFLERTTYAFEIPDISTQPRSNRPRPTFLAFSQPRLLTGIRRPQTSLSTATAATRPAR
jgi:hypothetical protein